MQHLVDLVQESVQPPMLWYVVQGHVQDGYRKLLGYYKEHYLASPDQVRLMAYYVIQRGVRGIYFFRYRIETPEFLGADRMAEIGLMGCEMEVVGKFFAAGQRLASVRAEMDGAEGESVEPVPFRLGDETLYLLTRHGRQFQVHVAAQPRRVLLKLAGPCAAVCRLRWPEPEVLPLQRGEGYTVVEIPDFDVTEFVLASKSSQSIDAYRVRMAVQLPEVAVFGVEGAEAAAGEVWEYLHQDRRRDAEGDRGRRVRNWTESGSGAEDARGR